MSFIATHSPSVAYGDSSLPEGAFRKFTSIEKHHQRKFLGGVRVFSAKVAEAKCLPFCYLLCVCTTANRLGSNTDDG